MEGKLLISYHLVVIILSSTKYRNENLLHFVTIYDVFFFFFIKQGNKINTEKSESVI